MCDDLLPIAKPWTDEREVQAVARTILSGWITQGPEVAAFEREFSAYAGSPFACAVSNCTAALHMALLAAGVGPGDEVVTVSHSFIATANSVRYCGAEPVFVDIDPATFNMDPSRIDAAITPRTKAILCVHQIGMPCDMVSLVPIARRRGLPLIEDAACAIGSEIRWNGAWEKIGKPHGDIACFSFHPRKVITTGDGGMLTTQDEGIDRKFRLLRQHGMSVPDSVRHKSKTVEFESYPVLGYNYRLTDLQAALGREQLKKLDEIVSRRRALAALYGQLLPGRTPDIVLPFEPEYVRTNWQSFCVRLPDYAGQHEIMQMMLDKGMATRRGIMCAHREPAYANTVAATASLPHSQSAQDRTILLPLFPQMSDADVVRVVEGLAAALQCAAEASRVSAL
jgi:dTDP-4-amino-4,6-dideoxygalactose transaminase